MSSFDRGNQLKTVSKPSYLCSHPFSWTREFQPCLELRCNYTLATHTQSMDARQQDYPQSGLSSPYPTFPDSASEGTSADQASAAQYPPQGQDPRASNLTPSSDYSINPSSARSGSFPEYIQRSYQPGAQGQAPGGMAQQQSPSMPLSDGHSSDHQQPQLKSDSDVPIDPSIAAATSPTYPHQQQYSPYTPHHDMQHYPGHPQTPMYASRPEWAGQYPQPGMHYGHPATSGPPAPAMVSPVQRPPTVSHPISGFYNVSFFFKIRACTRESRLLRVQSRVYSFEPFCFLDQCIR